jgi:hypothetical protein
MILLPSRKEDGSGNAGFRKLCKYSAIGKYASPSTGTRRQFIFSFSFVFYYLFCTAAVPLKVIVVVVTRLIFLKYTNYDMIIARRTAQNIIRLHGSRAEETTVIMLCTFEKKNNLVFNFKVFF